jgi:hypothetical protein
MSMRGIAGALLIASTIFVVSSCKKDEAPTQTQQVAPQLSAVPPSVTVGAGLSQNVLVSGGTPPYAIAAAPSAIATARLLNPDSLVATIQITGVTVASVATAVAIRDNSAPTQKTVTVPVRVQ